MLQIIVQGDGVKKKLKREIALNYSKSVTAH